MDRKLSAPARLSQRAVNRGANGCVARQRWPSGAARNPLERQRPALGRSVGANHLSSAPCVAAASAPDFTAASGAKSIVVEPVMPFPTSQPERFHRAVAALTAPVPTL